MRIGWSIPLPGPFRVSGNVGMPRAYRRSAAQKNRDTAARQAWQRERAATRTRQRREGFTWGEVAKQCLTALVLAYLFWGWLRPVSIFWLVCIPVVILARKPSPAAAKTAQQRPAGELQDAAVVVITPRDASPGQYRGQLIRSRAQAEGVDVSTYLTRLHGRPISVNQEQTTTEGEQK